MVQPGKMRENKARRQNKKGEGKIQGTESRNEAIQTEKAEDRKEEKRY